MCPGSCKELLEKCLVLKGLQNVRNIIIVFCYSLVFFLMLENMFVLSCRFPHTINVCSIINVMTVINAYIRYFLFLDYLRLKNVRSIIIVFCYSLVFFLFENMFVWSCPFPYTINVSSIINVMFATNACIRCYLVLRIHV